LVAETFESKARFTDECRHVSKTMSLIKITKLCLCLGVIFAFSGCKNTSGPATTSPSPAPKEISSTDQVVKAFGHFIPSASPPASLELDISPGFHINANPATFPYLIATEVQPGKTDGVTVGDKLVYPPPRMKTFSFADQPLAVYEDKVTIPIPLTAAPGAKGPRTIAFKIRVQACDNEKCYPPATLDAALSIDVDSIRR
jgi:DsbC/DsbD-like thiol-disulfide interchange protein